MTRTVEVSATAYRGATQQGKMLSHSLRDGEAASLCRRILAGNLVGDNSITDAEPTCERCRARDDRFSVVEEEIK